MNEREEALDAIYRVTGVTKKELQSRLRLHIAPARHIYALVRHQQGAKVNDIAEELMRTHSTISLMCSNVAVFWFDKPMKAKYSQVIAILGLPDIVEQMRKEDIRRHKAKLAKKQEAERIKKIANTRYTFNKDCPEAKKLHGFDIDDELIEWHCKNAEKWMLNYGKGHGRK